MHNSLEAPPVGLWPSVDKFGQTTRKKASEKSLGRRSGLRVATLNVGPLPSAEWSVFLKAVDLIWWFTSGIIRCRVQNLEHRQCEVFISGLQCGTG